MGRTHLMAYRGVPSAQIVAVASSDERKLSGNFGSVQGNLGNRVPAMDFSNMARYRTAAQLFSDPNVEAVDLCIPTHMHATVAKAALEAGKHVFIEKPMALSERDCWTTIASAKKARRVLMVGHVIRFWPAYATARSLVLSGKYGPVKAAFFCRKCAAPFWNKWMLNGSRSGGGILDLLIHDLDYCLYLLGQAKSVTATGVEEISRGLDVTTAQLEFHHNVSVTVHGGWYPCKSFHFSMQFSIVCKSAVLEFCYPENPSKIQVSQFGGGVKEIFVRDNDAFQIELQEFVKACRRGRESVECPVSDIPFSVRMAVAVRKSRKHGGRRFAL
jgi:predicted dehydrogenase